MLKLTVLVFAILVCTSHFGSDIKNIIFPIKKNAYGSRLLY